MGAGGSILIHLDGSLPWGERVRASKGKGLLRAKAWVGEHPCQYHPSTYYPPNTGELCGSQHLHSAVTLRACALPFTLTTSESLRTKVKTS